jgi:hypothetical protein
LRRNRTVWLLLDTATRRAIIQTAAAGGGVTDLGGIEQLPGSVGFSASPVQRRRSCSMPRDA